MTRQEAVKLRDALDAAIVAADLEGSDTVDVQAALSANLGAALNELEAAIVAVKGD